MLRGQSHRQDLHGGRWRTFSSAHTWTRYDGKSSPTSSTARIVPVRSIAAPQVTPRPTTTSLSTCTPTASPVVWRCRARGRVLEGKGAGAAQKGFGGWHVAGASGCSVHRDAIYVTWLVISVTREQRFDGVGGGGLRERSNR